MSHDSSPKKLIDMANQIGRSLRPKGMTLRSPGSPIPSPVSWDPSTRKKIVDHLDQGGEGLDPLVREAAQTLKAKQSDKAEYSG
jgi:formate dehydrogenase subunit delta